MPRQPQWPVGSTRSRGHRRLAAAVLAALVVLVVVGIFDYRNILHPRSDAPVKADVVVAIAGVNNPGRFRLAQSLIGEGYAATLLTDIPTAHRDRVCGHPPVQCFQPEPDTTQGEAEYVAAMAKVEGWHTVLLVLSTDQAYRARIRFTRCYHGDLRILTVPHTDSVLHALAYQDAALVKAEVWQRGC